MKNKTRRFFIMAILVANISMASARQNSFADNLKLALGIEHNDFNITVKDHARFGDQFRIDAKYDADIEWLIDGNVVKMAKGMRTSIFTPDIDMLPAQDPKHKVGFKVGKDPVTKKMRHLIELNYLEGTQRWIVSE